MRYLPGSIPAVNQEAREHGMTYGNWVASRDAPAGSRQAPAGKQRGPAQSCALGDGTSGQAEKPKKQLPPEEIARRKAFGTRLAQARKERWLTQTQLALQMGTRKGTICKWELGLSWPTEQNLQKLRELFGEELL